MVGNNKKCLWELYGMFNPKAVFSFVFPKLNPMLAKYFSAILLIVSKRKTSSNQGTLSFEFAEDICTTLFSLITVLSKSKAWDELEWNKEAFLGQLPKGRLIVSRAVQDGQTGSEANIHQWPTYWWGSRHWGACRLASESLHTSFLLGPYGRGHL